MRDNCIYADQVNEEHSKIIKDGLDREAKNKKGLEPDKSFSFSCFDKDNNFIAGAEGKSWCGFLYVRNLWVSEEFRGQNYGTLLMNKAENLARERKCKQICLITMDWQARPFYEKLGFKLEFIRTGLDKNSEAYYLRKYL